MAKRDSENVIAVRQKANEIRREKERAERRRRAVIQVGIIVGALLVVAAIVAVVIFASRGASTVNVPKASASITVDGTEVPLEVRDHRVRIGPEDASVVVSLYEDFSCPHCQEYEAVVGDTLEELVTLGDVAVEFHPIRFVTNYGNRAGSAATCVAVGAPEKWLEVRSGLFSMHDTSTDGWSNDQYRELLANQGITDEDVLDCVGEGRYVTWIDQNTAAATEAGITGSPTLLINGEKSELLGGAQLRATVDELLAAGE
jgi:protein-disulfide isomerase